MLDQLFTTIILGLIQGFAEWLPISSTAHLRITEHFLGFQATPLFNVFLHIGTLSVVIFYFRHDIKIVLTAMVHRDFYSEYGRFIPLIVVATIPTGIIGVVYDLYLGDTYQTILIIGVTFLFGAALLFSSKFGKENKTQISYREAIVMGTAQGTAIFPGLSRSGSTISCGLIQGVKREMVFKFSFLLSIPAIVGDLAVEAYHDRGSFSQGVGVTPLNLLIGLVFAVLAGYLAIVLVKKLVLSKRYHYFAAYTFALGTILIILALSGF
ncbi:MAG TPA: undecaprenyl-diphosphate phosphatase [Candidatus Binatia bacterium]|nr:undecaprenyl-diphosphate phosphatase [Candidatus Binatia bacterium]